MTAVLLTPLTGQFFDNNGNPLSGGLVYSYVAGTSFGTPQATYTNATGTTPATNPVVLDSAGRADIWGAGTYDFKITDSTNNTIDTISSVTAIFGSGDMTKAVYDPANISQQLVGVTAVQTITNKTLASPILSAGTSGAAAMTLTAGAVLGTQTAGAGEYDGRVLYFTPQQRGYLQNPQAYILDANLAGANSATAQSVLGVGLQTINSGTEYEFEGTYYLSKVAGVTSHNISLLFGGSAVLNRIDYDYIFTVNSTSLATPTAALLGSIQSATATVVNGTSIAAANAFATIKIHGTISVGTTGTFIPQYILSAAPGGAYTAVAGTSFKIWPVGATGGNVSVGGWA